MHKIKIFFDLSFKLAGKKNTKVVGVECDVDRRINGDLLKSMEELFIARVQTERDAIHFGDHCRHFADLWVEQIWGKPCWQLGNTSWRVLLN